MPLCGQRKARRVCPALGHQICAVCCGTKRLTQIPCPSDCVYLASAREHPPAIAVRQQQRDLAFLVPLMRDFNQRQSQLFLLTATFLARNPSPDPLIDASRKRFARLTRWSPVTGGRFSRSSGGSSGRMMDGEW